MTILIEINSKHQDTISWHDSETEARVYAKQMKDFGRIRWFATVPLDGNNKPVYFTQNGGK